MSDNQKAASILRQYAGELYQGHTIGGRWDDSSAHIKAEHDELLALADRLALGSTQERGEAVAWGVIEGGMIGFASGRESVARGYAKGNEGDVQLEVVPLYTHPTTAAGRVAELEALCDRLGDEYEKVVAMLAVGAYDGSTLDRIAALESQLVESRERLALAYGLLWHVNAGIDAPWGTPSLTPERAAMESRKILRDMLTNEQRGDGINAARDFMKALAADKEQTK